MRLGHHTLQFIDDDLLRHRPDDALRRLIHDRAPEHALRAAAMAAGTTSLRRDGARWLADGTTSLAELVRVSRED